MQENGREFEKIRIKRKNLEENGKKSNKFQKNLQ